MKVNFANPILNFRGELMKDHRDQNIFVKDIVSSALSSITDAGKDDKIALDGLSKRIWNSTEAIEISPEESVLIRKHIEHLPASMFTQIYNLLG